MALSIPSVLGKFPHVFSRYALYAVELQNPAHVEPPLQIHWAGSPKESIDGRPLEHEPDTE